MRSISVMSYQLTAFSHRRRQVSRPRYGKRSAGCAEPISHPMGRFFRRFMLILCAIAFAAFGGWATTDHFMALTAAGASFSSIFLAAT